jgi:hypothetical protein
LTWRTVAFSGRNKQLHRIVGKSGSQ